jgi:hypothetical protein
MNRYDDCEEFNTGDARHCPHHPHVKTSSEDGMFDGLCGECEYNASSEAMAESAWDAKNEEEKARINAEEDAREAYKAHLEDTDEICF